MINRPNPQVINTISLEFPKRYRLNLSFNKNMKEKRQDQIKHHQNVFNKSQYQTLIQDTKNFLQKNKMYSTLNQSNFLNRPSEMKGKKTSKNFSHKDSSIHRYRMRSISPNYMQKNNKIGHKLRKQSGIFDDQSLRLVLNDINHIKFKKLHAKKESKIYNITNLQQKQDSLDTKQYVSQEFRQQIKRNIKSSSNNFRPLFSRKRYDKNNRTKWAISQLF